MAFGKGSDASDHAKGGVPSALTLTVASTAVKSTGTMQFGLHLVDHCPRHSQMLVLLPWFRPTALAALAFTTLTQALAVVHMGC